MYSYDDIFQRNIGIFSPTQQKTIQNLRVAIAGTGGIGGIAAHLLARLGVGEISIADPETFDVSNINRQFGAYVDTVGLNKADVVGHELRRINPYLKLRVWDTGINKDNVYDFLENVDFVIDSIDYYDLESELALSKEAKRLNKWVFMSQVAGSIASFIYFSPTGNSLENIINNNPITDTTALAKIFFPVLPKEAFSDLGKRILSGETNVIPSWTNAPAVTALFMVDDIVKYFIKGESIFQAPDMYLLDLNERKFIIFKDHKIIM